MNNSKSIGEVFIFEIFVILGYPNPEGWGLGL